MIIKRYSQISKDIGIVIDGFNPDTRNRVVVERYVFRPVYRVFARSVDYVSPEVGERFFSTLEEANKYFSQLQQEKLYLF